MFRWVDIIWLDLEEGCWKAWAALIFLRINNIGGIFEHISNSYVKQNMDNFYLLKENTTACILLK